MSNIMDCEMNNAHESKRTKYIYIACLLSGIIYSITQSQLLGIITTLFICLLPFTINELQFFYIVFGLQFVRVVIPFEIGQAKYSFILLVYLVLFAKNFIDKKKLPIHSICVFFIFFIEVISSIINGILNIGDSINWIGSLLLLVIILYRYSDEIEYETMFLFFCLAEWTICLVNIFEELRIFGSTLNPGMYGIWTNQLGAFAFGKAYASIAGGNGIAFNNVLAIALCVFYLSKKNNSKYRWFCILSIIFFAYTGFMVISRAFYIEMALFVGLFILSQIKKTGRLFTTLLVFMIVAVVFYTQFYDKLIPSFERVLLRFEEGNADREYLIRTAFTTIFSNLWCTLFGSGSYYPNLYGFTAHNIYLDSFVSLGIIGGIVYWGVLISLIIRFIIKRYRITLTMLIPMIMLLTFKYISGSTRDVGFYFFFLLCLIFPKSQIEEG